MRNNTEHHANAVRVYLEGVQPVYSLVKIMFPGCQTCSQICGCFKGRVSEVWPVGCPIVRFLCVWLFLQSLSKEVLLGN